ncbi:hypothetical protein AB205_0035850 [Aquarana catesbeiana]|uniref:Uncharacterized protein n=1 Tax=Aquarana catesbeiana TaxID=8400 RepID=A0A2G9SET4_AQUCT|nr:hypothetical protein AB205_0035850 [Aquarana catesbeiana]
MDNQITKKKSWILEMLLQGFKAHFIQNIHSEIVVCSKKNEKNLTTLKQSVGLLSSVPSNITSFP